MKIKAYFGNYIFPAGKPIVIVTGWESENKFHCERFVFFETTKSFIRRPTSTNIKKQDFKALKDFKNADEGIEFFMDQEGRSLAEHIIYDIIIELNLNTSGSHLSNVRIDLQESSILTVLFYLKRKAKAEFIWLWQNTNVDSLRALLAAMHNVNISEYNYDN